MNVINYICSLISNCSGPTIHLYPCDAFSAIDDLSTCYPFVICDNEGRLMRTEDRKLIRICIYYADMEDTLTQAAAISKNLIISTSFALKNFDTLKKYKNLFNHIAFVNCRDEDADILVELM